MMAGYRRVNYYELCRLCTSSEGTKMHIFREEGRRRQLTYKIQTCLPLQVQEEDSLPKIICSTCVEKLESYFEFRESCVNAEAMLESYFTSLKYSDDLTREGKVSVYVKDEISKKKEEPANKLKLSVTAGNQTTTESANSNIQPIQFVTDADGNRYKVQVQGNLSSLVPTIANQQTTLPLGLALPTLQPQPQIHQTKQVSIATGPGTTQTVNRANTNRSDETTQTITADVSVPPPPPLMAAVTITPHTQEMLQRFGLTTKDRNSMTTITELLKLKNINVIDTTSLNIEQAQHQPHQQQQIETQQIPTHIRIDTNQLVTTPQVQRDISVLPVRGRKPEDKTEKERHEKINHEQTQVVLKHTTTKSDDEGEESLEMEPHSIEDDIEEISEDPNQIQSDDTVFPCTTCNKVFKRKEHLFQHRKLHSGERPFACNDCGKAFSRKEHLLRHRVSHTGQKLYSCDICRKSFSRKDNLHKHKKTHGINGPHVCDVCGKSFVVKHYYAMHKNTHENVDMEQANGTPVKNITTSVSATNPLPFKCDICVKSFASKPYLEAHRLRHRSKVKSDKNEEVQVTNEVTMSQPTILTSFTPTSLNLSNLNTGLTTINTNALLTPSILSSGTAGMIQIGNTSYICTPDLLEQYRRLHSS